MRATVSNGPHAALTRYQVVILKQVLDRVDDGVGRDELRDSFVDVRGRPTSPMPVGAAGRPWRSSRRTLTVLFGNDHQVALERLAEITVTVTSADGSRTRVYRVTLPVSEQPLAHCLKRCRRGGLQARRRRRRSVDALAACAGGDQSLQPLLGYARLGFTILPRFRTAS